MRCLRSAALSLGLLLLGALPAAAQEEKKPIEFHKDNGVLVLTSDNFDAAISLYDVVRPRSLFSVLPALRLSCASHCLRC